MSKEPLLSSNRKNCFARSSFGERLRLRFRLYVFRKSGRSTETFEKLFAVYKKAVPVRVELAPYLIVKGGSIDHTTPPIIADCGVKTGEIRELQCHGTWRTTNCLGERNHFGRATMIFAKRKLAVKGKCGDQLLARPPILLYHEFLPLHFIVQHIVARRAPHLNFPSETLYEFTIESNGMRTFTLSALYRRVGTTVTGHTIP